LLIELDGFKNRQNIVVIAATNNHKNIDSSLIRTGRFDLRIKTRLPNLEERSGIMRLKYRNVKNNISAEELKQIAEATQGWSGADLEGLVNESSYFAVRKGNEDVSFECLNEALTGI